MKQRGYPLVKVLCLDEIAPHKGRNRYQLIISAPELGLVLDVLSDRRKETLTAWFEKRGSAWCEHVQTCCADMWRPYHEVIAAMLPEANAVVDRFHVMKNLTDALSQSRRLIQRQADATTKAILKGCRWLLVKNQINLTPDEQSQLEPMLSNSYELNLCYQLKEAFRHWFEQKVSPVQAQETLHRWLQLAEASGYKAMQTFAKTVRNWEQSILNYFHDRYSNGFAEGVNLKIKLLNRRGFGYRNFDHFRLHVLVGFGS